MKKLILISLLGLANVYSNVQTGEVFELNGQKIAFHHCDRGIGECHNSFSTHLNQFCQDNGMTMSFAGKVPDVCSDNQLPVACGCVVSDEE